MVLKKGKKNIGSREDVWKGKAKKTSGGLYKKDLIKNKNGKIISKKMLKKNKIGGEKKNINLYIDNLKFDFEIAIHELMISLAGSNKNAKKNYKITANDLDIMLNNFLKCCCEKYNKNQLSNIKKLLIKDIDVSLVPEKVKTNLFPTSSISSTSTTSTTSSSTTSSLKQRIELITWNICYECMNNGLNYKGN